MTFTFRNTNDIIQKLNRYVASFSQLHSDLMYSFYKEKVFNIDYNEIVAKIAHLYNVPAVYFGQNDINVLLTTILNKYREYEKLYLSQRDINANQNTPISELENIPLTLEKYTATLLCHLKDLKGGFNLFKIAMDRQQQFFQEQDQALGNMDESEVLITNANTGSGSTNNGVRLSQEEIMMHTNTIKGMIEHYIDNNVRKDFKYIMELKLKFPY